MRAEAVALISAARQRRHLQPEGVREVWPPALNFMATIYTEMVGHNLDYWGVLEAGERFEIRGAPKICKVGTSKRKLWVRTRG